MAPAAGNADLEPSDVVEAETVDDTEGPSEQGLLILLALENHSAEHIAEQLGMSPARVLRLAGEAKAKLEALPKTAVRVDWRTPAPRAELVRIGRASLADLGVDPDDRVDAETDAELVAAVPKNTKDVLAWGWGRFINYCGAKGRKHDPPTVATVRQYIKDHWYMTHPSGVKAGQKRGRRGQPYAPGTVELAVYVISMVCNRVEGWDNPVRNSLVRDQLAAYAVKFDRAGFRTFEADPMTHEDSVALARSQDLGTVQGLRNAAMFRLQFDLGCRADEMCKIQMQDVVWVNDDLAIVTFTIGSTKTRSRRQVAVEADRELDWDVDPLRLLRAWYEAVVAAGYTAPGPLFRQVHRGDRRKDFDETGILGGKIQPAAIGFDAYEMAFNRAVDASGVGIDPVTKTRTRNITTHSNRAGHITEAGDAGMPLERVAMRTGHSPASPAIHRYFRSGRKTGDANSGTVIRRRRHTDDN